MSGNDLYMDDRPLARDEDRFDFSIEILAPAYTDTLIVCLARQGYAPYIGDDEKVHIEVSRHELRAVKLNTEGDGL